MTLYHRLRRWLGDDTTATYTADVPVYHYRVRNSWGGERTLYGHTFDRESGISGEVVYFSSVELVHQMLREQGFDWAWVPIGERNLDEQTRRFELQWEAVVDRTPFATETVSATIDRADETVVDYDVERITSGDD